MRYVTLTPDPSGPEFDSDSFNSAVSWRGIAFWAGVMILLMLLACAQPLEWMVAFTATDDGLYYPVLAKNLAAGRGCTYDGITRTNGFHPLWLLLIRPLYQIFDDSTAALRGVYGLIMILQLLALILLARLAQHWRMNIAGWSVAVLLLFLNVRSFTIWFSLLESPLALTTILWYLITVTRSGIKRFTRPCPAAVCGVVMGLSFLARLDFFLLALAYGIVWLWQILAQKGEEAHQRMRAALAAAGLCLATVLPYLVWNVRNFGRLLTVSAWMKSGPVSLKRSWATMSSWLADQFLPRVQHILGLHGVPTAWIGWGLTAVGATGLLWLASGSRRRRWLRAWAEAPEFPLFVGLHTLCIVLLTPFEAAASAWYWTPQILFLATSIGLALPPMSPRRRQALVGFSLALVLAQAALTPAMTRRKTMSWAKLEVASFLREHTTSTTRCMMFDSGITAYFSGRDFVGLNGLIGDFEQAELLRARRYADVAERYGVSLLVLDMPESLLSLFQSNVRYVSSVRTKFENFQESTKPFVVFSGTPQQLESIRLARYGQVPINEILHF